MRGEIDRLFDRYGTGVTITKEEVAEIVKAGVDSKIRKLNKMLLCERMMNETHYAEIARLRESIEEAHQCDDEITVKSFCEVICDTYDCISENGAPYLRLSPGERMPKVVTRLTEDRVNKYLNILMKNAKVKPIKETVLKNVTTTTTTVAVGSEQSNGTNATAATSPAGAASTIAGGNATSAASTGTAATTVGTTATTKGTTATTKGTTTTTVATKSANSTAPC